VSPVSACSSARCGGRSPERAPFPAAGVVFEPPLEAAPAIAAPPRASAVIEATISVVILSLSVWFLSVVCADRSKQTSCS
jgi:hypothetical protein